MFRKQKTDRLWKLPNKKGIIKDLKLNGHQEN